MTETNLKICVNEILGKSGWGETLSTVARQLNSGYYEPNGVGLFIQSGRNRTMYDIYDAYEYIVGSSSVISGRWAAIRIDAGVEPFENENVAEFNNVLGKLPKPFRGEFRGKNAGADGFVEWNKDILLDLDGGEKRMSKVACIPGNAPLEAGSLVRGKTLEAFNMGSSYARWPYGSTDIHLFIKQGCMGMRECVGVELRDISACIEYHA